jgi:P27 family predicted phage terminase small subunit
MPRGGQNRKPRQAKIVQGTFRKDRNPGREPAPALWPAPPRPPAGLNRWARREWKRLAAELQEQQLLTTVDLVALEICCTVFGVFKECADAIRKAGGLAKYLSGEDANSHTRPLFSAQRHAWAGYKSYLTEFGLSPASRNRIEAPAKKTGGIDPMEWLLDHEGPLPR